MKIPTHANGQFLRALTAINCVCTMDTHWLNISNVSSCGLRSKTSAIKVF